MLCRNVEAAEVVAEEIRKETEGEVLVHKLDLSSLKSVRECAEQLGNSLEKVRRACWTNFYQSSD